MTTPPPAEVTPEPTPLEPGTHLRLSVLAYIAISLLYGLPMLLWPDLIWDTIAGAEDGVLEGLVGMRWAGAVLVAWAVGGFLVLTRPKGRQTMVTIFALQFSLAAAALVASALLDEFAWAPTWFVLVAIAAVGSAALYLWYGRWAGRAVLTA